MRRSGDGAEADGIWDREVHVWVVHGGWRRLARRGIAATILASYVDADPRALVFARGPHGKPELLTCGRSGERLAFSTSTAPGALALAVAAAPVGVDIEPRDRAVSVDGLVAAVCTPSERRELAAAATTAVASRREAFIWCWTGKEACAKASGLGLGAPLELIDVGVGPVGGARVVAPVVAPTGAGDGALGPWELHRVGELAEYAVAIALL
jgi:4'-phosphopantetheinyl transferase